MSQPHHMYTHATSPYYDDLCGVVPIYVIPNQLRREYF